MKRALASVLVPLALTFLGGCTASDSAEEEAAPPAGPTSPTPLTTSSSLTLHGAVVDGMTQAPLAAAPLVAADAAGRPLGTAKTNADGSYTLAITVGPDGFDGTLAVSAPGYWTRRFFAPTKRLPRPAQEVTFHMQSDQLVALQGSMLGIDIAETKGMVAMTVQDASGSFVAPDFPTEIDLDVPYDARIYLDANGRPDPARKSGWFAIFLNVAPGPVTGSATLVKDGARTAYGATKVIAKAKELDGSWIRP